MNSRPGDPARDPLTNGSSIAPGNTQSHGFLVEAQQRHQPDNLEHPPFKRQRTETVPATAPTINNQIQQNGNSQTVPHWGRQDVFIQCLANQVFPHVDRELANLPRDKYDVQKIGTKVVEIVTGADFTAAYKLGNGRVSDAFERLLAARIPVETRALLMLPEYRFKSYTPVPVPKVPPVLAPPQAPSGYASAPLPPPPPRPGSAIAPTFPAADERRYSNSPIPLPAVPGRQEAYRGVNPPSGLRYPHAPVPSHATTGIHRPTILPPPPSTQVITIKDDDEEKQGKGTPSAAITVPQPNSTVRPPMVLDPPSASVTQPSVSNLPVDLPENFVSEPRRRGRVSRWRKRVEEEQRPQNRGIVTTSAQNYRSRAHALVWRGHEDSVDSRGLSSRLFSEAKRPYLSAEQRANISAGVQGFVRFDDSVVPRPTIFHVDFTADEIKALRNLCRRVLGLSSGSRKQDLAKDLRKQLKKHRGDIVKVLDAIRSESELSHRNRTDVERFLHDLVNHKVAGNPSILALKRDKYDLHGELARSSQINSLLFARETSGNRGMALRAPLNFPNEFVKCREDELELRREWTDCAGDIATIAWVSNDGFICGTTEHSDAHNQQYNKPGNLVLGSCSQGTLRAYPDHRIVRPVVEKGENSTDAMRQSQDPWLYSSVVSSDYDDVHGRAFTSGFDRKVKVWKVDPSGSSMVLLGEWSHGGNVNFVAASNPIQTLDCWALDINELTVMPISFGSCYITAGCTDGITYVWDTAQGDKPIHTLRHGEPIEEFRGDREHEDVGVKFTAWGRTLDRFYTGSSDGVVKVWNLPDRTLGVVQGPNYVETGLYRREAHLDEDPRLPLKASFNGLQQETRRQFSEGVRRYLSPLRSITKESFLKAKEAHFTNLPLDFSVDLLEEETKQALEAEGVDWQLNEGTLDLVYEDDENDNEDLVSSGANGSDIDEF
ncbi:defective in DNA methylation-9 protein [Neurospora crassa OR74A]|uniref:Defective in DNA methylation-9 protein n=1 Tax=Neurospora crassa (strain ATCC 24698 / 74-OR23-1A / CBS 708.71 / DSM 1257 / FGSC 987) TaxID=367110 RepID=Q7RVP2_NEUCR|nr:defective in DNA methylation-9 protein [Neurospora crassa OR74A]EAA27042.3 defective in DNA methylation-9 protein [Neurospora crassa OR74A]|eukprot:XP_956278.3 defective in DNA methylation-9 protein [Neurospora crassa OR74A]